MKIDDMNLDELKRNWVINYKKEMMAHYKRRCLEMYIYKREREIQNENK